MKVHIYYSSPSKCFRYNYDASWDIVIDRAGDGVLPFGHVNFFELPTKPTKRQLRKMKRLFRKSVTCEVQRLEWENSWEGIHCDILKS